MKYAEPVSLIILMLLSTVVSGYENLHIWFLVFVYYIRYMEADRSYNQVLEIALKNDELFRKIMKDTEKWNIK